MQQFDVNVQHHEQIRCGFCRESVFGPSYGYGAPPPKEMHLVKVETGTGDTYRPLYQLANVADPADTWRRAVAEGWSKALVFGTDQVVCPKCRRKESNLPARS